MRVPNRRFAKIQGPWMDGNLGSLKRISAALLMILLLCSCSDPLYANRKSRQLAVAPASVDFGSVTVGTSSTQIITVTNTGDWFINISAATVAGSGFSLNRPALPLSLQPGQSASFSVTFLPSALGAAMGSLSLSSNAQNSSTTISLSGTGAQPLISVAPSNVSFGSVPVGFTTTQTVTVSNPGNANLNVMQAAGPGTGFSVTGLTMPLTVPPGQAAKFSISFTPTVAGNSTSSVVLVSNAPASPTSVSLSGAGVQRSSPQISVMPGTLAFGSVAVGSSGTQSVTVSNTGSATLSITAANVTGSGFSTSGLSLPMTVAAGGSGTITVNFAPSTSGSVTGSLSVASNAPTSPTAIALNGSGVASAPQLSVSPTSLAFGSESVGTTSGSQSVTLTNNSTSSTIDVSSIDCTGPFTFTGVSLPETLNPGQSVSLSVNFTPTAAGAETGTLTVTSTAGNSPNNVTLSGTGTDSLGTPIPAAFWGMIDNHTSFPLNVPYGQFRFWDTSNAQWPDIATCQPASGSPSDPCFNWNKNGSGLDYMLDGLYSAGVNNVFYTLSRTPPWASQNTTDSNCDYYSQGTEFHGACYPPTDLNSDGTGTDQIWKNWVTAIAARVNDSTYLATHSHIKYWEIWNEFYRSTTLASYTGSDSWQGTYNQLIRMTEDARCVITGKGVIHNYPLFGNVTSCTATAIDPTAVIVSPSGAAGYAGAIAEMQNFLYCNNSPKATCTVGSAGAAAVDVINLHLGAQKKQPESVANTDIPNLRAILHSAELAKPLWDGEASWGIPTLSGAIWTDGYSRAGFIPRFFATYWSVGVSEQMWYSYDTNDGGLYNGTSLITPEATAWAITYDWLEGATPTNSPFCSSSGTVYTCDFTRANGHIARLVWDSQYGPGGTSAPSNCTTSANPTICGNTAYNVPSQFGLDWVDILGTTHAASGTVTIGANPILLEGQN